MPGPYELPSPPPFIPYLLLLLLATACSDREIPGGVFNGGHEIRLAIQVSDDIVDAPKVSGTLTAILNGTATEYPIGIERRGGHSMSYPKHSYEVDLEQDVPLGELPEDDDWILNANYIDKTFLRHVFSYELFRRMSPGNVAADYRFAEVSLNGDYRGLYVLMEKLDRSSLRVKKGGERTFIFKEPPVFRAPFSRLHSPRDSNVHHQTYPKFHKGDRSVALDELRFSIDSTTDQTFDRGISRLIDVDNFLDWHLLLLLTNNQDGLLKNFYLYRPTDESPIKVAPWDYDHSFGRDGDNERNLNERSIDPTRNVLLRRLLTRPWYTERLRSRWGELQDNGLLTPGNLKDRVDFLSEELRPLVERNFTRWPVDAEAYYDAATFAEEIEWMKAFIDLRHAYLTEYFTFL